MTISKQLLKEYLTKRIEELQIEVKEGRFCYLRNSINGGIAELKFLIKILDRNSFKEEDSPEQK